MLKTALVVASGLAGVLSLVCSLPIAREELERWPRLLWLERNRFFIAVGAVAFAAICAVLAVVDVQRDQNDLRMTRGPDGQVTPRTSLDALQQEVEATAARNSAAAVDLFRSGERLMEAREFGAAAVAYKQSAEKIPTKAALTNLALCARYTADLPAALDAARRAVDLPENTGSSKVSHANALLQLGITLTELGKRDEARTCLTDALTRFRESAENLGLGAAEYALAQFEYRGGNTPEATRLLVSASKRFAQEQDIVGQASTMNVLGVARLEAGATNEGLAALDSAVALYRRSGDRIGEAGTLLNIGSARQDKCELDAALVAYDECALAAERINEKLILALATVNAASVLLEKNDVPEAERRARNALQFAGETATPEDEAWAHLVLASVFRYQGRFADATPEIAVARQKFATVSAVGGLVTTIEEARIAAKAGDLAHALQLLDSADTVAAAAGYELYRPAILMVRADVSEAQGDESKAIGLLQAAQRSNRERGIQNCDARSVEVRLRAASEKSRRGA